MFNFFFHRKAASRPHYKLHYNELLFFITQEMHRVATKAFNIREIRRDSARFRFVRGDDISRRASRRHQREGRGREKKNKRERIARGAKRRQNRGFKVAESVTRRGRDNKSAWPTARSSQRAVSSLPPLRAAGVLAGGEGGVKRTEGGRGREREESRRGGRKGKRDYPDIHRTLFFILHYPCSTPLYSIMPAPRINDESVPFTLHVPSASARREPPYVHQVARRPLPSLVCNSDKHRPARVSRLGYRMRKVHTCYTLRKSFRNSRQISSECIF